MFNVDAAFARHEAEERENGETGKNGSAGIDDGKQDCVAVAVVVELVVRTKSGKGAKTDCVREEDLSASIDPDLKRILIFLK